MTRSMMLVCMSALKRPIHAILGIVAGSIVVALGGPSAAFAVEVFALETRVMSMTCQDGEREVLRFPPGSGAMPASLTLDRDGQMVQFGGTNVLPPESANGLIAARGRVGVVGFVPMMYHASLDQRKAEWVGTMITVGGAFDPTGTNLDRAGFDATIPFGAREWMTFFGRATLDGAGTPTAMEVTFTWGLQHHNVDNPAFVEAASCIIYREMTSVIAK